jgi:serine/threonine protein kinase
MQSEIGSEAYMEHLFCLIWKSLEKLGLPISEPTVSHFHKWLRSIPILHNPPKLIKKDASLIGHSVAFTDITHVAQGTYGVLFQALRNDHESVFLKVTPKHPKVLLMEGIFQTIAGVVLEAHGIQGAIPKVLDICNHPTAGILLSIEQLPDCLVFSDYLKDAIRWGIQDIQNDQIVFSVIAQLAVYLSILEETIGMNHRDLKSTNVLLVAPEVSVDVKITIQGATYLMKCGQRAVLIDYGFACIGEIGERKLVASVGEFLPETDFCPKEGRDLFLFFASLWNIAALQDSLTPKGKCLFKKWLHDSVGGSWFDWFNREKPTENMKSMYLLTMGRDFRASAASPGAVLKDIADAYSSIVVVSS